MHQQFLLILFESFGLNNSVARHSLKQDMLVYEEPTLSSSLGTMVRIDIVELVVLMKGSDHKHFSSAYQGELNPNQSEMPAATLEKNEPIAFATSVIPATIKPPAIDNP